MKRARVVRENPEHVLELAERRVLAPLVVPWPEPPGVVLGPEVPVFHDRYERRQVAVRRDGEVVVVHEALRLVLRGVRVLGVVVVRVVWRDPRIPLLLGV